MRTVSSGCFCKFGVLYVAVLTKRALLAEVDCCELLAEESVLKDLAKRVLSILSTARSARTIGERLIERALKGICVFC